MSESSRFATFTFEHQFPHPIAVAFRAARTVTVSTEKAALYVATVDALVRHVTALLLADYRSQNPSEESLNSIEESLHYPTLERYSTLALKLAGLLQQAPFFPELVAALLGDGRKALEDATALSHEVLMDSDTLTNEESAFALLGDLEEAVLILLEAFSVLASSPLGVFRRQRDAGEGFQGFFIRWMGCGGAPLPISVEFSEDVPVETPVLLSNDTTRLLPLAPFVMQDRHPTNGVEALYVLNGLRDSHTLRLENFLSGGFITCPLTLQGEAAPFVEYVTLNESDVSPMELTPSPETLQRMRFKSKLLSAEKVVGNRYKTMGFIGRGGVGAVYRSFDLDGGEDKVVKVLYPDLARSEHFTKYFLETGKLLSKLEHPNLVPVISAGYSADIQENYIVMDYMAGGSLFELMLRRGLLPLRRALEITIGIVSAVEHLHSVELIHGSVHPGNILFDKSGAPRLGDFGILKVPTSRMAALRPLERIHSVRYAAPEMLMGDQVDNRADLYCIGLVLYEMVTGQVPAKSEFVPPSHVIFPLPESMDAVLRVALSAQPARRYPTAEAFRSALEEVLSDLGEEYDVSPTATAQQLAGHLSDVQFGHSETLDREREEFLAAEDWEGLARTLHMKLDEVWDLDEKVHWMLELADIYFEKLNDSQKAVALYRDSLELAQDNTKAISALLAHFEKTEEWESLAELLQDLTTQSESKSQKAGYLERLVELYRNKLDDQKQAADYLEALVDQVGARSEYIEQLVSLKAEVEDWAGAAEALEAWLKASEGREQTLKLLRELGHLYGEKLAMPEEAVRVWSNVRELQPDARDALEALRALYRQTFSFHSLAELLRTMSQSAEFSDDEKLSLLQELGEVLSSYLYDSSEATRVWERVLELQPRHYTALSYLERLHLREGRHDRYLEILDKKIILATDPEEKATVLLSAAKARLQLLGDVEGAGKMLEEAHELVPEHPGVQETLEQYYQDHADSDTLAAYLLEKLERQSETHHRKDTFGQLATLFEQVKKDENAAFQVVKRAFRENRTDLSLRREIERLAVAASAVDDLLGFYLEEMEATTGAVQEYLGGRLAHMATAHGTSDDQAAEVLQRGAELTSHRGDLLTALLTVYRNQEDWAKVAVVLLHQIRAAKVEDMTELFEELSEIILQNLGNTEEGREALNRMIDLVENAATSQALEAVKDTCRGLEEWDRFTDIVEQEVALETDPDKAQALRVELGEAALGRGQLDKALPMLQQAFEKAPNDEKIQQLLEQAYAEREDWNSLLDLYRKLIPQTVDIIRKQELMQKVAELELEVFGNNEGAIELYRQLTVLKPENEEYFDRLSEGLRRGEKHTELCWLLEQRARTSKGDRKKALLREMADIYLEKLVNPDAALQALRQLVKMDPADDEVFEKTKALCVEEQRHDTLLRLLGDRARQAEGEEKAALRVEMARLSAMEMGLLPPAKGYLDEALSLVPGHEGAFQLYREVLERQEDWKGLAELLEKQLRSISDEAKLASLGYELAMLYVERLELRVRAAEVLERVLEWKPDDIDAAILLAHQYAALGQWDKTAPILVMLDQFRDRLDESAARDYVFLSGQTYEALVERTKAITAFRQLLGRGHRELEVKQRLASLLYLEEHHEEARGLITELLEEESLDLDTTRKFRDMLADVNQRLGRKDKSMSYLEERLQESPNDPEVLGKLIGLAREQGDAERELVYLTKIIEVETDPKKRFPLLVRMGDLYKSDENTADDALASYERASQLRPDSTAILIAMAELHMQAERWEEAAGFFKRAEDEEQDAKKRSALALTQGLLFADYAEQPEKAAEHLKRSLVHDINQWDAFSTLERLAVERGDWSAQRETYEETIEAVGVQGAPEVLNKLHRNLGRILLEKFGDSKGALQHFEIAMKADPEDRETRTMLAGLYVQTGENLEGALAEFRRMLAHKPRDLDLLHMTRRTLSKMKRYDEAWILAGVLRVLGGATDKELAFYNKLASPTLRIKPQRLDMDLLRRDLLASEADWELSEIIRILFDRMSPRLSLQAPKALGLTRKERLDPETHKVLATLVDINSRILGLSTPEVYVKVGTGSIHKEATHPSCIIAPQAFVESKRGQEIRFQLAHTMALFLPQHLPVGVLETTSLRALLGNLLKLAIPSLPDPAGDPKTNAELRKQMEKAVPGVDLAQIRELATALRNTGGGLSVKKWLVGVEKTACRFGLLLANDLTATISSVQSGTSRLSSATPEELVEDLIAFSLTESYPRLREHLGMSITLG